MQVYVTVNVGRKFGTSAGVHLICGLLNTGFSAISWYQVKPLMTWYGRIWVWQIPYIFEGQHRKGLLPETSRRDKSHCVNYPYLPQHSHLVTRSKIWSLLLVPQIQTGLKFRDKSLRLVPQNPLCELFVEKSLHPVRLCKLLNSGN